MIAQELQPQLNERNEPFFRFLGVPTLIRATGATTGGAFGLIEQWEVPPGFASPYHTHHREDEAFYVLEGELDVACDGEWMVARPGTFVFAPRGIPHGFAVRGSSPVRMLILCAPGGFEQFVLEMAEPEPGTQPSTPDMAKLAALAEKYGIDLLGPLPKDTA